MGLWFGPFPFVTTIPAFLLSPASPLAVLIPMSLFFGWNPGLFRGQTNVPRRSLFLVAGLPVLTVIWFVKGWSYGLHYQGAKFTHDICVANVGSLILLWSVFVFTEIKRSFAATSSRIFCCSRGWGGMRFHTWGSCLRRGSQEARTIIQGRQVGGRGPIRCLDRVLSPTFQCNCGPISPCELSELRRHRAVGATILPSSPSPSSR